MKKKFVMLLVITMLFSMLTGFTKEKNQTHEITYEELMELANKYDFEPVIVNESLAGKEVVSNLTKAEVESFIIEFKEKNSKPLYFKEDTYITPKDTYINSLDTIVTLSGETDDGGNSTWEVVNTARTLSKIGNFLVSEFRLRKSVCALYSFEYQWEPGGPGLGRNYRFTGATSPNVTHVNPGAYKLKSVSPRISHWSAGYITLSFSGVYNAGFYIITQGQQLRISLGDNTFEGHTNFYISEVK